jgi:uncharacterized protein (DUF697 family)
MTAANRGRTISFERVRRSPQALLELATSVPDTNEDATSAPRARAQAIAQAAGLKTAAITAVMSLPPGPIGWLTIPVELACVWRIQAQMVADIAGAYGRTAALSQPVILQCLFERIVPQVARDLTVNLGQRVLTQRCVLRAIESLACHVGVGIGRRTVGRSVTRVLPVAGAAVAAYYASSDTRQVGRAAIALFECEAGRPQAIR